jgi:hypothetical protein
MISAKGGLVRITRSLSAIIATILVAAIPLTASAQFSIGVGFTIGSAPPPMPVYAQPAAPYPNYQWTPGYWAWGAAGYYWVPGTWVAPPSVGLYWTPGYWGFSGGYYGWNAGYWGASVGFYGGINYGFGYPGTGFYGGTWGPGGFAYNTAVANVNRTVINNTYNKTVINKNVTCGNNCHVSYNGGKGGISAKPTPAQIDARKSGRAPTTAQKDQATLAGQDRNQLASVNKGSPKLTASQKPFSANNKPPNSAPITTADKQNASKIPTHGNNTANTKAPTTTQNKPSNTMQQNKPSNTMQSKPANTTQKPANKAPSTTNKAPSTQQKPQKPASAMQPHHNSMGSQAPHKQPPKHPQNQAHHTGGAMRPQGGRPPGGAAHPQSGSHPQGNGGKPPSNGNGNKPPRH